MRSLSAFIVKNKFSAVFLMCDENTLRCCVPYIVRECPVLKDAEIIEIESGEASKCIDVCQGIWKTLAEYGTDRQALIINLGGGVVSDLGGFCASVYKRGISFINIPTSLLAMADASVGGKTAIDFEGIKNLIGTFTMPRAVFVNPLFLDTLPEREFNNGMAELFKIALVTDKQFWKDLTGKKFTPAFIEKSISLKNAIVSEDPYDNGKRLVLNYGHTVGHAIEATDPSLILHGEAVVAGMMIENNIAVKKKILKPATALAINGFLSNFYSKVLPRFNPSDLIEFLENDKKRSGGVHKLSLLTAVGHCRTGVTAKTADIIAAAETYLSEI
jgi:3-dehydroquinate synthase